MLPRFEAGAALKALVASQGDRAARRAHHVPGAAGPSGLRHHRLLVAAHLHFRRRAFVARPARSGGRRETGARLVEGYGLTESSGVVSTNGYEGENRLGTIGQPLPATRVRLLDQDDPTRDAD